MAESPAVYEYFVDEAGDLTLFDKQGRIIVGSEGVSNVFMLGVVHLPDVERAKEALNMLRRELMADPYFNGVPSMQPEAGKTANCFHAKNDLPEVRREVFRVLRTIDATVQVVIRRKRELAYEARNWQELFGVKLTSNDMYDGVVKRLFKSFPFDPGEHRIVFARRGKSDRQLALEDAIRRARRTAPPESARSHPTHVIRSSVPSESAGLQVVDYYLWALQRMYERGEMRFFDLLADRYRLIIDLDDGAHYTAANPISLEKIRPVAG